jgi:hypothetical protein
VYRLRKRAEIRRQIPDRKSVQEGQPDRIADLLEEAAEAFESAKEMNARPVVHEVRCTYPQCQATNGCVGACSKTEPVHASDISQERVDETAKIEHEFECPRCGHCCQQREWVGLTDQEIYDIREDHTYNDEEFNEFGFAKDIEAKLKEKNT